MSTYTHKTQKYIISTNSQKISKVTQHQMMVKIKFPNSNLKLMPHQIMAAYKIIHDTFASGLHVCLCMYICVCMCLSCMHATICIHTHKHTDTHKHIHVPYICFPRAHARTLISMNIHMHLCNHVNVQFGRFLEIVFSTYKAWTLSGICF